MKNAKALLEALDGECSCRWPAGCKVCNAYNGAHTRILGQAPATLRVAIKLAAAAEEASEDHPPDCLEQHRQWRLSGIDVRCRPCEALAEWEALGAHEVEEEA